MTREEFKEKAGVELDAELFEACETAGLIKKLEIMLRDAEYSNSSYRYLMAERDSLRARLDAITAILNIK